jgi:hypothetical protein
MRQVKGKCCDDDSANDNDGDGTPVALIALRADRQSAPARGAANSDSPTPSWHDAGS